MNFKKRRRLNRVWSLLSILSLACLVSCGGKNQSASSTATTSAATVTEINSLPKATGPVVGSGSSAAIKEANIFRRAAATGETFSTAVNNAWSSSHSRAYCETIGMVKDLLSDAAQPDKILCYIGTMKANSAFDSTVYDGTYKYYKLVENGSDMGKVKFKVVKNSAGSISLFELFACMDNGSSQSEYIKQEISSTTVTVTTKNKGSGTTGGSFTYGGSVSASGAINSSGSWTSKTITASRYFTQTVGGDTSLYGNSATLSQYSGNITLSGYMKGDRYYSTTRENFSNAFYSVAQILTPSTMSTFAIGDGSSKYQISWNMYNNGTLDQSFAPAVTTDSWNGDTRVKFSTAADGTYYSSADAGTVPTAVDPTVINFSGSEAWDCNDADGGSTGFSTATITAAIESAFGTCNTSFGDHSQWLSCYSAQ